MSLREKITSRPEAIEVINMLNELLPARKESSTDFQIIINNDKIYKDAEKFPQGRPSKEHLCAKDDILDLFNRLERFFPSVLGDSTFLKFLSKFTIQISREGNYRDDILFKEAFIDFAVTCYDIYKSSGIPSSIIGTKIHSFSLNQVANILSEARSVFGADESSEA